MMITAPITSKRCATCEYWRGIRSIETSGKSIKYEQNGQCTNASSSYRGKEISGSQNCSHWRQWSALR